MSPARKRRRAAWGRSGVTLAVTRVTPERSTLRDAHGRRQVRRRNSWWDERDSNRHLGGAQGGAQECHWHRNRRTSSGRCRPCHKAMPLGMPCLTPGEARSTQCVKHRRRRLVTGQRRRVHLDAVVMRFLLSRLQPVCPRHPKRPGSQRRRPLGTWLHRSLRLEPRCAGPFAG